MKAFLSLHLLAVGIALVTYGLRCVRRRRTPTLSLSMHDKIHWLEGPDGVDSGAILICGGVAAIVAGVVTLVCAPESEAMAIVIIPLFLTLIFFSRLRYRQVNKGVQSPNQPFERDS